MILKNIRHRIRLFWQTTRLVHRYDVLIEKAFTVKYADSVSFGHHCTLQSGVYLYGSRSNQPVRFGNHVAVSGGCVLLGEGGLELGDYTHLGPHVVITTQYGNSDSDMLQENVSLKYAPVSLGRGCWIGAGTIIMPGTRLGERCIVTPSSVVFGSWPDGSKLSGNPARAQQKTRA